MRNSFVFYKDWKEAISGLPDDLRLEIYDSIIEYATSGKIPALKPMAGLAFNFIKTTIDRDIEKYMSIAERNRNNGKGGGRPRINPEKPKKPNGLFGNPEKPKKPDNDNVNDSDYISPTNVVDIARDGSFENFWDMYDKKVGDKYKLKKKWEKLPERKRLAIIAYLPKYIATTQNKQYRKNPETFLNNRGWEDEIIDAKKPQANTDLKNVNELWT